MDSEDRFEEAVRQALQRVEAPAGFAGRVAAQATGLKVRSSSRSRLWLWRPAAAIAALLALVAGGGYAKQRQAQQARAAIAQRDFMVAMQLANDTLDRVSGRVEREDIGKFVQIAEEKRKVESR